MAADAVAPPLPPGAAGLLHSIDTGAVLGASRQLHVLGDALIDVAAARAQSPEALAAEVGALVDHVRRTRGASSQAVVNGLERMARPVLARGHGDVAGDRGASLVASVRQFRQDLDGWVASVRRHGQELLRPYARVLAYDYSSTVAHVLADAARAGRALTVFVPEARSLDGGAKYLPDWGDLDMEIRLVPDAGLGWAVGQCEAAVVGAETLSADGGCYNTIGTAVVAHEAGRAGIPFYVLSVLLKTDLRDAGGRRRSPSLDFLPRLKIPVRAGARPVLRGDFPDLDYTQPADITGVVTESGVVGPDQVGQLAGAAFGLVGSLDG